MEGQAHPARGKCLLTVMIIIRGDARSASKRCTLAPTYWTSVYTPIESQAHFEACAVLTPCSSVATACTQLMQPWATFTNVAKPRSYTNIAVLNAACGGRDEDKAGTAGGDGQIGSVFS